MTLSLRKNPSRKCPDPPTITTTGDKMMKRSERAKPTAGRTANSKQKKKTCEKPKGEHEESMNHTEDPHVLHKVNEELTKNTLKTRTGSFRTERR